MITGDDYTETLHSDTYDAIDSSKANLSNKNVFICGASKGIGRSITLSFAKAGVSCIAIGARSDQAALEKDISESSFPDVSLPDSRSILKVARPVTRSITLPPPVS